VADCKEPCTNCCDCGRLAGETDSVCCFLQGGSQLSRIQVAHTRNVRASLSPDQTSEALQHEAMSSRRGRSNPPASAPAAQLAAKKPPGRKRLVPRNLGCELVDAEENRKEEAAVKKAKKDSTEEGLGNFGTELLFWWGHDIVGFSAKCQLKKRFDREVVLAALMSFDKVAVPTPAQIKAQYKTQTGTAWVGDTRFEPDNEVDSDVPESEEEKESDEEAIESDGPPAKKQKISNGGKKNDSRDKCQHCRKENSEDFCKHCHLRSDLSYDHAQNVDIRNEMRQISAAAAASSSKLGKRDTELERLANSGMNFPRFNDRTPISSFDAFKSGKTAYQATSFVPASESLLKLIRSGKLVDIGFALPISIGDAAAEAADKESTGTLKTQADGSVKMNLTTIAPPINSLNQFTRALIRTILPALAEQPRAMFDWITLTSTLIALDEGGTQWAKAKAYLERVLIHKVNTREEFGSLDQGVLLGVQSEMSMKRKENPSAPSRSSPTKATPHDPARKGMVKENGNARVCSQFNSERGCTYGEGCKYTHICNRTGCGGKHSATNCKVGTTAAIFSPHPSGASLYGGGSGSSGAGMKHLKKEDAD